MHRYHGKSSRQQWLDTEEARLRRNTNAALIVLAVLWFVSIALCIAGQWL